MNERKLVFKWCAILATFFMSCQQSFAEVPWCRELDRVTEKFIHSITEKYDLQVFASGGAMMTDIKEVQLQFFSGYSADIEKARSIVVDAVRLLLNDINSDIGLRPHLANYPFLPRNIVMGIGFAANAQDSNSIDLVWASNDKISYAIRREDSGYHKVYEESYSDAVMQVEENSFWH